MTASFPCKPKPRAKKLGLMTFHHKTKQVYPDEQKEVCAKTQLMAASESWNNLKLNFSRDFQLLYTTLTMFFIQKFLMIGNIDQIVMLPTPHLVLTSFTKKPRLISTPVGSTIPRTDFRMPSSGQAAFPTSGSQKRLKPFRNQLI